MSAGAEDGPRRRVRGSLLAAVFWRMGLTMLLAVAAVWTLLLIEFNSHLDSMRDRSLNGQAADVLRHLTLNPDGTVAVALPVPLAAAYRAAEDAPRYVVLARDGRVLAASPRLQGPLTMDGAPAGLGRWRYFEGRDPITGAAIYGAAVRPEAYDGALQIQVAQSAVHHDVLADTLLDEALDEYFWIAAAVFAAILLVAYLTLRSALRPLRDLSEEAAAIGPGTLERRLAPDPLPREIRPLVEAVNSALDRVQEGFHVQRRFTADAAHEMRTPIALLRTHLDRLHPDQARALAADLDNLERVVGQLLKLAQVDALVVPEGAHADLAQVARDAVGFLAPTAIRAGRSLAVEGAESAPVEGDADALETALRNLIENALAHTAAGEEVVVEVAADPPRLAVLDRGPGVPAADRAHLFDRFWRKDRRGASGAGLGLSITARIAAAHRAALSVDDRPGGGAVFALTFPTP